MLKKTRFLGLALQSLLGLLMLVSLAACSHSSSSAPPVVTPAAGIPANTVRMHYHRSDGVYTGWGIWDWLPSGVTAGPVSNTGTWPGPNYAFSTMDADGWGIHVDIPMMAGSTQINFLFVNAAGTSQSADMTATFTSLASAGAELWVLDGNLTVFTAEPPKNMLQTSGAQALWLDPGTLIWPGAPGVTYTLYVSPTGGISSNTAGVTGATASYPLTKAAALSTSLQNQYPQYAQAAGLAVPAGVTPATLLQGQLVVAAFDSSGALITGTSVQTWPLLDNLYATAATAKTLGLSFTNDVPTFALWAPTATSVGLNVYASPSASATTYPMVLDPASGVWTYTAADATWTNKAYYDFSVKVFSRAANNAVVTNEVIDPYSVSLCANAKLSMVLNLADAATAPSGWATQTLIPTSATPTDSVIYELHVRDFSAYNTGTFATNAGKYLAFTEANPGMTHLQTLASAGLTHVHLLPVFATTSVDEVNGVNVDPSVPAATGASAAAATWMTAGNSSYANAAPQNVDLFNWGYDPWVYGAPEGAFSSNAQDGLARVKEFRQMVQALHKAGLRVIMDVVYNHTAAAGQDAHSVLDRIVPGYYNRLDANGNVANATCCSDIANEHALMGKLTTDTLVRWANQYKIDGFRFDEMGFMPVPLMKNALAAVNAVTAADGRGSTYFYGEGWSTSATPFAGASQANVGGTGIGTFNDRLRDSIRGGGPFDSGAAMVTNQGFGSGLGYDPIAPATVASQTPTALANQNVIEVSLAGNLAAFPLNGSTTGATLKYGGQSAGYTTLPQENLAYVSCHDNETLWDVSQYKHPAGTSPSDRARAQVVDLSTVLLANGVAFVQAGDDLLRSKSMDGNSYNSGDYFNRIFWDGSSNNWAVGIPLQNTGNNLANLVQEQAALTNANATVTPSELLSASAAFQDFLVVRKSSSMFHLGDAASIIGNVRFPDQGLGQQPGVIVMQVGDGTTPVGDAAFASALTVFNAAKTPATITYPWYAGRNVALHPAQAAGHDAVAASASFTAATGTFTVPARTTAVFVESANNTFTTAYPTMYLRGDMNGWGTTNPMKRVAPNTWQVSIALPLAADAAGKSYGFKFDTGTWTNNWGGGATAGFANGGNNLSITAATAGTYVFTFNDATLAYTVVPPVWFPGTPTGLAASVKATSVTLNWANSGGTVYNILRSATGAAGSFTQIGTSADGTAGYLDLGLTTGTTYYYQVNASNGVFTSGATPTLSATPTATVGLSWNYTTMYINGNWNSWATGASNTTGVMTKGATSNLWTVTLPITSGEGAMVGLGFQFKFDTDNNWGNTSNLAWTSTGTGLTGVASLSAAGDGNISVTLPAAGTYTITFNDNTLAYTIKQN